MLLLLSFAFVAGVCAFAGRTATRIYREAQELLELLELEIERHTEAPEISSSPAKASKASAEQVVPIAPSEANDAEDWSLPMGNEAMSNRRDLVSLVGEVFQEGNWEVARAAVSELLSLGASKRSHVVAAGRGLLRAPFLSSVAGAIFVVASVGVSSVAWQTVLAMIGLSVVTSLLCQILMSRARKLNKRFVEVCEVLERELEQAARGGQA